MSLNGCTFVKLLKAEGMGKVLFFCFKKINDVFLRMAMPLPPHITEILISD